MLPILLSVAAISISGVMMPGPMFAVTLAKSYRSPWAGAKISLGHAVIEVPIILAVYFGLAPFFQDVTVRVMLSILGGGMIIWMGIGMFRSRHTVVREGRDSPYNAFAAGIIMSALNPFFLLWWATIGSMLIMRFVDFGVVVLALFIIVHWSCDLLWLSFISVLIYRTKSMWGSGFQQWVFIGCSLLLVGFGGWLLFSGVRLAI